MQLVLCACDGDVEEAPFLVKAVVSTYDFGTAAKGAGAAKAEESTKKEGEE